MILNSYIIIESNHKFFFKNIKKRLDMTHSGSIWSSSPVRMLLNFLNASPQRRLISP